MRADVTDTIPTLVVRGDALLIRQFSVTVVSGPARGTQIISQREDLSIGSGQGVDLVLADAAVSRHHCVLRIVDHGLEVRDLDSTNGTSFGDLEIARGVIRSGARIRVGNTTLLVDVLDAQVQHPLHASDRLGDLFGASMAMRRVYPRIQQFAQSASPVLIVGETGTGKDLAAATIHDISPRRHGPFVVVDCAGLPRQRVESELFASVHGAFSRATGGTLFLDAIGELPLALQASLLRALESRDLDVRVIAATHRDLRTEINHKRFRADLYYRLDVLRIALPPLRDRPADIVGLATKFWQDIRPDTAPPDELLHDVAQQSWPGNVRELRNAIERAAVMGYEPAVSISYASAKAEVVASWERMWLAELMAAHAGNLSSAARAARMGRTNLRELIGKHGLSRATDDDNE